MSGSSSDSGGGQDVSGVDEVFSALSSPTRRHVLEELVHRGPSTASELEGRIPVTRQAIVKHLRALHGAGLVARVPEGREVRFEARPEPLGGAASWIAEVGGEWDQRLRRLRDQLADR